ncbi:asparagine synthase (glutamine-hydrolyzing) [Nitrosomonas sp.]|uniref:asparagine synthase (glutamine-hydrolyzing) n=1 Tax=Nitrosomonas sp. TaxID=42353 RepID=UPI00374D17C8
MCGIAGFIHLGESRHVSSFRLTAMLKPIVHRGPDDGGVWVDAQHSVALGHRRLSILDLSPAGHQPMTSSCGRYVIVFNGEIYNHLDIRKNLETAGSLPICGWRGHSDTETLLACFSAWGIEKTLQSTVGMFALALWDKHEKSLTLARDRIGEKPLYYGWQNGVFLFGSELKALKAHPAFSGEMDWHAASTFLRLNYIPAPSSIYQGIFKLVPGTFLPLTQHHVQQRTLPPPVPYWSLGDAAAQGLENPFIGSFADAVDQLETLVRQAVQLQSVADVPVGAFLSGGIDSSTVVAMMQSSTTSKVTTFSIGMPDAKMDESQHAAAVARHLGTNHVEHVIQPHEALDLIPRLSEIWDEPFADSSQIPTYLVSQLAKQQVSVALSGDGGDEFFLGYSQYVFYQKIWRARHLGRLPWTPAFKALKMFEGSQRVASVSRRSQTVVNAWRQPNAQMLNRYWFDRYRQRKVPLAEQCSVEMLDFPVLGDVASTAGLWDAGTYLPDDILVKVDRAAMANSLETRAPLLDHRIIEFACSLPLKYKLNGGISKKVLREVLYRHVPKSIVNRPKMGFDIPLSSWLRKELRPWVEETISKIEHDSPNFDRPAIFQLWNEHLSGQIDHTDQIWALLSLLTFINRQN